MKNLLLLIVLFVVIVSCKKNKNNTTSTDISALISGKWKLDSVGYDLNGNGKIDSDEVSLYSPMVGVKTETYGNNGKMLDTSVTYLGIGYTTYRQYQYSLIANDTYLQIKALDTGMYYGDTYSYHIDNISSSKMQLFDSSMPTHARYIYVKQ